LDLRFANYGPDINTNKYIGELEQKLGALRIQNTEFQSKLSAELMMKEQTLSSNAQL
jgi:hypothetical protein